MQVDHDLILYLEELGRITLTEQERESTLIDLQNVLSYMDTLNELDTSGVEPLPHSFPLTNVMREDVVTSKANPSAILANAPEQKDNCFQVPMTVE